MADYSRAYRQRKREKTLTEGKPMSDYRKTSVERTENYGKHGQEVSSVRKLLSQRSIERSCGL